MNRSLRIKVCHLFRNSTLLTCIFPEKLNIVWLSTSFPGLFMCLGNILCCTGTDYYCCLVFRKTKDLYLIITQKLIILKSGGFHADFVKSGRFHVDFMWNPADFMKSLVKAPTLHSSNWSFCWNTCFYNFGWISQVKSGWNPLDFMGEIHQISRVKSPTLNSSNWRVFAETLAFIILGGFHRWYLGEICQISWVKSLVIGPHPAFINWRVFAETLAL